MPAFLHKVFVINHCIGKFARQNIILILYFAFFCRLHDRRSSLEKRRRRRIAFFIVLGLLLVGVLAVALGTGLGLEKKKDEDSTESPTQHITSKSLV